MKSRTLLLGIGLLLGLAPAIVTAQPARSRSLDLTVGAGGLVGANANVYRSSLGGALDATFSAPVGKHLRVGVSWSGQSGLENTDDCIRPDPGSPCLVSLPFVSSWTALLGRDWQLSRALSVRTYGGPSVVGIYRRTSSPHDWVTKGGLAGRLDLIVHGPVNLIASMRGVLVPDMPNNAKGIHAFGLGIGVH